MIRVYNNDYAIIDIPRSDAVFSCQLNQGASSSTTSYYIGDEEENKRQGKLFFENAPDIYLDRKAMVQYIRKVIEILESYKYVYKDGDGFIKENLIYFESLNKDYINIRKFLPRNNDFNNRYYAFDNDDICVQKMRTSLFSNITQLLVFKSDDKYIAKPLLKKNWRENLMNNKLDKNVVIEAFNNFVKEQMESKGKSEKEAITTFGAKYGILLNKSQVGSNELISLSNYNNQSNIEHVEFGKTLCDGIKGDDIFAEPVDDEENFDFAWFVGACGNDEEGKWTDFSDIYIREGRWENRYETKYTDLINTIQPGDKIVIKSSYTRKNNLPFNNYGKTVGVMGIKATGIVVENYHDGHNIKVNWNKLEPQKEWFGDGVLRTTMHCVKARDGYIKRALLDFVFNDIAQDYAICEEQYRTDEKEDIEEIVEVEFDKYSKEKFLIDVFMSEYEYENLKQVLLYKKNVILQGAPGVGKTYLARRFAYSLLEEKNENLVEMIQFHQNYSYEDFMMGYKPQEDGSFKLQTGVFYNFCKRAEKDPNRKYFFIIDEINRGNISKIFGELMMLLEGDKRSEKIKLAYKDELFGVPENVYFIGLMNTADRSLALMDYALRRRFSFIEIEPAFGKESFVDHLRQYINDEVIVNKVNNKIKKLNDFIGDSEKSNLGKGFKIGHSYFCVEPVDGQTDKEWYNNIIKYEVLPLLDEYWWDDEDKVEEWKAELLEN